MNRDQVIAHFERLVEDLPRTSRLVAELQSPNPEDDRAIKFAIVGYSYYRPTETWGVDEFNFVDVRRREVADQGALWVEFVCLAAGYLLGLQKAEKLTENDCTVFELLLPGYMWMHSERFSKE